MGWPHPDPVGGNAEDGTDGRPSRGSTTRILWLPDCPVRALRGPVAGPDDPPAGSMRGAVLEAPEDEPDSHPLPGPQWMTELRRGSAMPSARNPMRTTFIFQVDRGFLGQEQPRERASHVQRCPRWPPRSWTSMTKASGESLFPRSPGTPWSADEGRAGGR